MTAPPPGGVAPRPAVLDLPTPLGPGRAHVHGGGRSGLLVLSHGAGGGIGAPDLVAVGDAARTAGWTVALVEQPWRVAGRRIAPAPPRLDEAWTAMLPRLLEDLAAAGPLVTGGRSAGARVACRTACRSGAAGVVALSFPLHPPGRPDRSRAAELDAGVPVLVVQGARDPFGTPAEVRADAPAGVLVHEVAGDHSLRRGAAGAADVVRDWLAGFAGQVRSASEPGGS